MCDSDGDSGWSGGDSSSDAGSDGWDSESDASGDSWDSGSDAGSDGLDSESDAGSDGWDSESDASGDSWDSGSDAGSDGWDSESDAGSDGWDSESDAGSDSWDSGSDAGSDGWDSESDAGSDGWDSESDAGSDGWDSESDASGDSWDSGSDAGSDGWDSESDAGSDGWDSESDAGSDGWDSESDAGSDGWNSESDAGSDSWDSGSDAGSDSWDSESDAGSDGWDSESENGSVRQNSGSDVHESNDSNRNDSAIDIQDSENQSEINSLASNNNAQGSDSASEANQHTTPEVVQPKGPELYSETSTPEIDQPKEPEIDSDEQKTEMNQPKEPEQNQDNPNEMPYDDGNRTNHPSEADIPKEPEEEPNLPEEMPDKEASDVTVEPFNDVNPDQIPDVQKQPYSEIPTDETADPEENDDKSNHADALVQAKEPEHHTDAEKENSYTEQEKNNTEEPVPEENTSDKTNVNNTFTMIDPNEIKGIDSSSDRFWDHRGNTKEDYTNLASHLPELQEQLNRGVTPEDIANDPSLRDTYNAYYNPDNMVKVEKRDGEYHFQDDGRHRVEAAKELGYDIPVEVIDLSQPEESAKPAMENSGKNAADGEVSETQTAGTDDVEEDHAADDPEKDADDKTDTDSGTDKQSETEQPQEKETANDKNAPDILFVPFTSDTETDYAAADMIYPEETASVPGQEKQQENTKPDSEPKENENPQDLEKNPEDEAENIVYRMDDNNEIFMVNDVLLPDRTFTVNGITYTTDKNGNVSSFEGNLVYTPQNERNNKEQLKVGGADRENSDDGTHLISRMLNGSPYIENLSSVRDTINRGDLKRSENEWVKALKNGEKVHVTGNISYPPDSSRPSKIEYKYSIQDSERYLMLDNKKGSTELTNELKESIPESKYQDLEKSIKNHQERGEVISVTSVLKVYNKEGKLEGVRVGIRNENSNIKSYRWF